MARRSKSSGQVRGEKDALAFYRQRDGIFFRDGGDHAWSDYSDGDEAESYLLQLVEASQDRSLFSTPLIKGIRDWPSLYHLSPKRANLLRPFADLLRSDVLEVGAGCGAVTRFLGENGGSVIAVEGSARRAKIAQQRNADLANVRVVCDRLESFKTEKRFDVITVIGVLEYARRYIAGSVYAQSALLSTLSKLLAPDGVIIIAIGNKLGLKYFAGAREDQFGLPFFGINDNNAGSTATLGRDELESMLNRAGFSSQRWYVPCPDYKLPNCVLAPEIGSSYGDLAIGLLAQSVAADPQRPSDPTFSLEQAWSVVYENGLLDRLANSFLVVAGRSERSLEAISHGKDLAWYFSLDRHPAFTKQTRFTKHRNSINVVREGLTPVSAPAVPISCVLRNASYVPGQNWWLKLVSIVNHPGWTVSQVAEWARPWIDALLKECGLSNLDVAAMGRLVDGHFFDAAPFNLACDELGRMRFFDLQWRMTPQIELGYVIFRGLKDSFDRVTSSAAPASQVPVSINQLIIAVLAELGLLVTKIELDRYALMERQVQAWVQGSLDTSRPDEAIASSWTQTLRTRSPVERHAGDLERAHMLQALAEREREASELRDRASVSERQQQELAALGDEHARVWGMLTEREHELVELRQRISAAEQHRQELVVLGEEHARVLVALAEREREVSELRDKASVSERQQQELAALGDESARVRSMLTEREQEVSALREELVGIRQQQEELVELRNKELLKLRHELDFGRQELESLRIVGEERLTERTRELEKTRLLLRDAQTSVQSQAGELDAVQQALARERAEHDRARSELLRLVEVERRSLRKQQDDLAELESANLALKQALALEDGLSADLAAAEKALSQEKVRAGALAAEGALAGGSVQALQAQARELRRTIEQQAKLLAEPAESRGRSKIGTGGLWARFWGRQKKRSRAQEWERQAIRTSKLFSPVWYVNRYPDVLESGSDPLEHFLDYGASENRDPHPLFDVRWYRERYPQVSDSSVNPLAHYAAIGVSEGLAPHPLFDTDFYLRNNPDVAASGVNPLHHFMTHGGFEGRDPHPLFDSSWYLEQNPDVAAVRDNPLVHYLTHGWKEGRDPHPDFDPESYSATGLAGKAPLLQFAGLRERRLTRKPRANSNALASIQMLGIATSASDSNIQRSADKTNASAPADYVSNADDAQREIIVKLFDAQWYLSRYSDVVAANADPLQHYFAEGACRGYDPHPLFDSSWYLESNPEVAAAKENPLLSFVRAGASKRRDPHPLFDVGYYFDCNPDVLSSGANPLLHYLEFGWKERRNPHPLFNTGWYLDKYADVASAGANPLIHFLLYGGNERRDPCHGVSAHRYLEKHKHVEGSGINPVVHAILNGDLEVSSPAILWPRQPLPQPKAPEANDWSDIVGKKNVSDASIDVIVPVYRGYDDTLACIHSVLRHRQNTSYELVVINDAGPEPALDAELTRLSAGGLFTYLKNRENVGFVQTVNTALELHSDRDAVLLNSDTVVYSNWLDRLLAHAASDPSIATITPFSNNATVCSYPETNRANRYLLEVPPELLDALASKCNSGKRNDLPSGVGFCMFMRRDAIRRVGVLDYETFGRGYGEENDFCMRASKAGYNNVFAHDVYVYHTGEVSFSDLATKRRKAAQVLLDQKHPDYHQQVRQYIAADPSRPARVSLDISRFSNSLKSRPIVFVTHTKGGGIERHIEDFQHMLASEDAPVIILRVGGVEGRNVELEIPNVPQRLHLPNIASFDAVNDRALLVEMLSELNPVLIHVHSSAGLSREATISLFDTIRASGIPYYYTWHDFAPICHRNQFVRLDRKYCGEPDLSVCRKCLAEDYEALEDEFDPQERRAVFSEFLGGATKVIVPSEAARERAEKLSDPGKIILRPHPEPFDPSAWIEWAPTGARPLKIAVVGAIGPHKGSDVIYEMLLDASMRDLPLEIMLIGHCDRPNLSGFSKFKTSGRYFNDDEAIASLKGYAPHICFLPSIWPETYCYTLSLAMRCGIPPVVFDLGAPAERVRAAGWGRVLPLFLVNRTDELVDTLLQAPLQQMWAERRKPEIQRTLSTMDYYAVSRKWR